MKARQVGELSGVSFEGDTSMPARSSDPKPEVVPRGMTRYQWEQLQKLTTPVEKLAVFAGDRPYGRSCRTRVFVLSPPQHESLPHHIRDVTRDV